MDYRQTILNAIEGRKRLEKALADTLRRHELLTGRLSELEAKKNTLAGELAGLDEKIRQTTDAGGDAGELMKNRNSLIVALSDTKKMLGLTRGALEHSSADIKNAKGALAKELQNAVMRIRDVTTEEMQKRLDGIGADLDAWTNSVYEAADALNVEVPGAGMEIFLSGRHVDHALS